MAAQPTRAARPASPSAVVIDAGHGGDRDVGRSSAAGVRGPRGTLEKDVTLDLARRVAAHLGSRATLTRDADVNRSIAERQRLAESRGAEVFLSLHANGGAPHQRGAEAYVHDRAGERSRALATALQQELAVLGGPQRAVTRGELAVLTPERLPPSTAACLLEVDYLSSPEGEARLRDPRALDHLARAIARGVDRYMGRGPRARALGGGDGADPVTGQPPPPRPADPAEVASGLLQHYLRPYLDRLSEQARRELARAWRESPGGVIAAGTILGAAGIGWLVGTNSSVPRLPAIPLDMLGGPFEGAELQLQVNGPITQPESFGFRVTFRERAPRTRDRGAGEQRGPDHPDIDAILADVGTSPREIAERTNGPEFETEMPDDPSHWNLGAGDTFEDFVRVIAGMLYDEVEHEPERPWVNIVDYYDLPFLPTGFGRGVTRIVDTLMEALPDRFGQIVQVSLAIRVGGEVRWVPVIPTSARESYQGRRFGQGTLASANNNPPRTGRRRAQASNVHNAGPFTFTYFYVPNNEVTFEFAAIGVEPDDPTDFQPPVDAEVVVTLKSHADGAQLGQHRVSIVDDRRGYVTFTGSTEDPIPSDCDYEVTVYNRIDNSQGLTLRMWTWT